MYYAHKYRAHHLIHFIHFIISISFFSSLCFGFRDCSMFIGSIGTIDTIPKSCRTIFIGSVIYNWNVHVKRWLNRIINAFDSFLLQNFIEADGDANRAKNRWSINLDRVGRPSFYYTKWDVKSEQMLEWNARDANSICALANDRNR